MRNTIIISRNIEIGTFFCFILIHLHFCSNNENITNSAVILYAFIYIFFSIVDETIKMWNNYGDIQLFIFPKMIFSCKFIVFHLLCFISGISSLLLLLIDFSNNCCSFLFLDLIAKRFLLIFPNTFKSVNER